MMRKFVQQYNLRFALLFALFLAACTPIQPGGVTENGTPPPPISALFDSFRWQTDGAYGYRMLRPATWHPINLGDARGYYPPASVVETDRLLLVARNLLALETGFNSVALSSFREHPTIEAWTAALEADWQRNALTYTPEHSLPNARIYALKPPTPDQIQLVAYLVADDQPLVISLDIFGRYAEILRLRDEGILADFVTMVASVTAVEIDSQNIAPPLVEDDATPAGTSTPAEKIVASPAASTAPETILLYSVQTLNPAAPTLPTWGLRAWPETTTTFNYPTFDTIYGDLGTGENYPGYFLNFRPQQSPNGRYVLVPGIDGFNPPEKPGTGLWLVGLQETIVRRLLKTVPVAVWSPQSDAIAYVEGDTLYRYNLDDDTPQPLFSHADLTSPYLAWSPDGNWLAVVTTAQGEVDPKTNYPALTQTVWLVSPIREEASALATVPALPMQAVNAELAWSADSQHLKLRNYVLDLNGNQLDLGTIIRTNGIDWLPTTPLLLVNRAEGLQVVDIGGKLVRTLSTQPAEVWAFTRDGQRLAYILYNMAQNEREVIVFDLQNQSESFRTTLGGDFSTLNLLRWNATGDLLYLDDWGYNSPIWALPVAPTNESAVAEPSVVVEDGLLVEVLVKAGIDQPIPADAAALADRKLERWSSTSPDGAWVAEGLMAFPKVGDNLYYTELRVKKADGLVEWMPVAEWSRFGLGYTTPQPLRWSPNGYYLYFTNTPVPDGCGLFVNAADLQRLDLADGTVREVLPFGATWTLAIAPDAQKAVYSQGDTLYLLDLATANYASIKMEEVEAGAQWGNFVWSPDGRQVAFTIAYQPCLPPAWSHSLLLLDTHTLTITTVLAKDPRRLTIAEWVDAGHLALSDYDGKTWLLDLATGATEMVECIKC